MNKSLCLGNHAINLEKNKKTEGRARGTGNPKRICCLRTWHQYNFRCEFIQWNSSSAERCILFHTILQTNGLTL